jgi:hypothetical protein
MIYLILSLLALPVILYKLKQKGYRIAGYSFGSQN